MSVRREAANRVSINSANGGRAAEPTAAASPEASLGATAGSCWGVLFAGVEAPSRASELAQFTTATGQQFLAELKSRMASQHAALRSTADARRTELAAKLASLKTQAAQVRELGNHVSHVPLEREPLLCAGRLRGVI
jgi:hypothetical protein